jgi:hypothetical protein
MRGSWPNSRMEFDPWRIFVRHRESGGRRKMNGRGLGRKGQEEEEEEEEECPLETKRITQRVSLVNIIDGG